VVAAGVYVEMVVVAGVYVEMVVVAAGVSCPLAWA
jgi:hypothetical protein